MKICYIIFMTLNAVIFSNTLTKHRTNKSYKNTNEKIKIKYSSNTDDNN